MGNLHFWIFQRWHLTTEPGVNTGLCICSHLFSLGPFKAQLLEFRFFHLRVPFLARFYCINGSHSALLLGKWGLSRVLHWLQTTYVAKNDLNLPSTRIKDIHHGSWSRRVLDIEPRATCLPDRKSRGGTTPPVTEFSFHSPAWTVLWPVPHVWFIGPGPMTDYLFVKLFTLNLGGHTAVPGRITVEPLRTSLWTLPIEKVSSYGHWQVCNLCRKLDGGRLKPTNQCELDRGPRESYHRKRGEAV